MIQHDKEPFKFTKSNLIFASIVGVILVFVNIIVQDFSISTFIYSVFTSLGVLLVSAIIAYLFWLIRGQKENGGTTVFNIAVVFMFFASLGEMGQISKNQNQSISDLKESAARFKENTLANPDSLDANYGALSTDIRKTINEMLKTSSGDERKIYLILQDYFEKSDSINLEWGKATDALASDRFLDFSILNNKAEYQYQKELTQNYIDQARVMKEFTENRVNYLRNKSKNIAKKNKYYVTFMNALTKKVKLQKPIFTPYIDAHIQYGQEFKKLVVLLEKEKWKFKDGEINFDKPLMNSEYMMIINELTELEEVINRLFVELIEIM